MLKKTILSLVMVSSSLFATTSNNITSNNIQDLYEQLKTQIKTVELKDNKHTLIVAKHFPAKDEYKLKLLNNKKTSKKYLLNVEIKQNLLLCKNPFISKYFNNPDNKLVYLYITKDLKYSTFINKTSCEYIYKRNENYKQEFIKTFDKQFNNFVKQLKENGYFKNMDNLEKLKIIMKDLKTSLPVKLDNITLLENANYDTNKKVINFYNKLLHKPENKIYQFIIKLDKENRLQKTLVVYLKNQVKEKDYLKNLVINKNWKVIYHYDIEGKKYNIIIDKNIL